MAANGEVRHNLVGVVHKARAPEVMNLLSVFFLLAIGFLLSLQGDSNEILPVTLRRIMRRGSTEVSHIPRGCLFIDSRLLRLLDFS